MTKIQGYYNMDWTKLKEIHECIYNDNIYCDKECSILCEMHPTHKRIQSTEYNNQITIEEILNEKKERKN